MMDYAVMYTIVELVLFHATVMNYIESGCAFTHYKTELSMLGALIY